MRLKSAMLVLAFLFWTPLLLVAQQNPAILPEGLTFGYLPNGTTAPVQTVSVYNIGSNAVTVTAITSSMTEYTVVSGTLPVTLTTGQRADFGIQFKPDGARSFSGHLTFTVTGQPSQIVTLSGYGTNPAAVPTLNTTSMTFAPQALGTTSPPQTLTITNKGTTSVSLTNVIVTYPYIQTGWTKSTTIAAGKSLNLSISYMPSAATSQPGTISLTYNVAAPQGASLRGSGESATGLGISSYPTLPAGTQGYLYQATLNAVGGTAPYYWQLQSGSSLPSGLSLSSAGMITGTLASSVAVGNYTFTVQARDSESTPKMVSSTMTLPVGAIFGTSTSPVWNRV